MKQAGTGLPNLIAIKRHLRESRQAVWTGGGEPAFLRRGRRHQGSRRVNRTDAPQARCCAEWRITGRIAQVSQQVMHDCRPIMPLLRYWPCLSSRVGCRVIGTGSAADSGRGLQFVRAGFTAETPRRRGTHHATSKSGWLPGGSFTSASSAPSVSYFLNSASRRLGGERA